MEINKDPKNVLYFFYAILFAILVGSTNRFLTFFSLLISVAVAAYISFTFENSLYICEGILLLLLGQNFSIGIGAHIFSNQDNSLKFLTQIPFLAIATIWAIKCLIKKGHNEMMPRITFGILLLMIILSLLNNTEWILSALISFRNMVTFYLAFNIAENCLNEEDDINRLAKFIIKSGIILVFFGIILLIGGYKLYKMIRIHEVYIAKAAPFFEGGLDNRFYTSLFSGKSYIRMGSIIYEPINLAYFLSLAFLCSVLKSPYNGSKRIIGVALLGIGLFLTFGKGGYLIAFLSLACIVTDYLFGRIMPDFNPIIKQRTIIVAMYVSLCIFVLYYVIYIGDPVLNHVKGIYYTFLSVIKRPFGYGLGNGGNVSFSIGNNNGDWFSAGGETALMSFMYQIGIQGALAFIACLVSISKSINTENDKFFKLCYYLPMVLVIISMLQDNTFTPQCITAYMLLIGGASQISKKTGKDNSND